MDKVLWEKEASEVGRDELLAYTLAKISPFEWVRITMFDKDCVGIDPPVFVWRYESADESLYGTIKECIESYQGNVQWVMNKGDGTKPYNSTRNYSIEPALFQQLRETVGNDILAEVIEQNYKEDYRKAIDDIENLCRHIEDKFNLFTVRPKFPVPR